MFGFGRKKEEPEPKGTAKTFVEATGGGWGNPPDILPVDGGAHADYVGEVLYQASEYARDEGIQIGEEFDYIITDIPQGIASPREIMLGLMMRAQDYGLSASAMHNEKIRFIREE